MIAIPVGIVGIVGLALLLVLAAISDAGGGRRSSGQQLAKGAIPHRTISPDQIPQPPRRGDAA